MLALPQEIKMFCQSPEVRPAAQKASRVVAKAALSACCLEGIHVLCNQRDEIGVVLVIVGNLSWSADLVAWGTRRQAPYWVVYPFRLLLSSEGWPICVCRVFEFCRNHVAVVWHVGHNHICQGFEVEGESIWVDKEHPRGTDAIKQKNYVPTYYPVCNPIT